MSAKNAVAALTDRDLAAWLKNEYPQAIAAILSFLPPERAVAVLGELPTSFAAECLSRLLTLGELDPAAPVLIAAEARRRARKGRRPDDALLAAVAAAPASFDVVRDAVAERRPGLLPGTGREYATEATILNEEQEARLLAEWNDMERRQLARPATDFSQSALDALLRPRFVDTPPPAPFEAPGLAKVLGDAAISLSASMRAAYGLESAEVALDQVSSVYAGDWANSLDLPGMLFPLTQPGGRFGIVAYFNGLLVYSHLDLFFGGEQDGSAMRIEGRPFTPLEKAAMASVAGRVAQAVSGAFRVAITAGDPVCNPSHLTEAGGVAQAPQEAALLAKFRVDLGARGGPCSVLFPRPAFNDLWAASVAARAGGRAGRRHDVVLVTPALSLGDAELLALRAGDEILLPGDRVELWSDGVKVGEASVAVADDGEEGPLASLRVTHVDLGRYLGN